MAFQCPNCKSNLFHMEKQGSQIEVNCWKKDCGWSLKAEEKSD